MKGRTYIHVLLWFDFWFTVKNSSFSVSFQPDVFVVVCCTKLPVAFLWDYDRISWIIDSKSTWTSVTTCQLSLLVNCRAATVKNFGLFWLNLVNCCQCFGMSLFYVKYICSFVAKLLLMRWPLAWLKLTLRVDKSSTNLFGWGEGGAVTSVGWQITLCDPIDKWRPVVLRWISRRTIHSFTFTFTFDDNYYRILRHFKLYLKLEFL